MTGGRLVSQTSVRYSPPAFDLNSLLSVYFSAVAGAFLAFFLELRSSLFGLHLVQDLPSLWAATQQRCRHSLPCAAASWQQVSFSAFFSAAIPGQASREEAQHSATQIPFDFIIFMLLARNHPLAKVILYGREPTVTA